MMKYFDLLPEPVINCAAPAAFIVDHARSSCNNGLIATMEAGPKVDDSGLVIHSPYIDLIFEGRKTIEVRNVALQPQTYWVGNSGLVWGIVKIGKRAPIYTHAKYAEANDKHHWPHAQNGGHEGSGLPFGTTHFNEVIEYAAYASRVPYMRFHGAIGRFSYRVLPLPELKRLWVIWGREGLDSKGRSRQVREQSML